MAKHPDTKRLDWLERAAQFAVILSGSEKEGFYVSTGTAYLRELRPNLRAAIDALSDPNAAPTTPARRAAAAE